MKILFTICGRAGSKGIKNKNIKTFLDYPLPYYTLAAIDLFCEKHKELVCDIALNTDSKELVCLVQNYKKEIVLIHRKPELAGDVVGKIEVIHDTLQEMEKSKNCIYDMVIDLDLTAPLRRECDLENLYHKKINSDCDIVFSVTDARRNPYFNMVMEKGMYCDRVMSSDFTARQQAPEIYDMNASMYAYTPAFLKSEKAFFDGKCGMIKMFDTAVLDLDYENDLILMEVIARYLFEHNAEFRKLYEHIPNCLKKESKRG